MKNVAFRVLLGIPLTYLLLTGCATSKTGAIDITTQPTKSTPSLEKIHFSGNGSGSYFSKKEHFRGGDYKFSWTLKDCDYSDAWLNQISTQQVFSVSAPSNPKNWHGQGYLYGLMENDNFIWVNSANGKCAWTADFTSIQ